MHCDVHVTAENKHALPTFGSLDSFLIMRSQRYKPLSRRLDRCDRVIQAESRDPFGGNVYYVTMQITFFTGKFRNGERNLHCDVVHITTKWVSSLTLDCNGVFTMIKSYGGLTLLAAMDYCLCVSVYMCICVLPITATRSRTRSSLREMLMAAVS